MLNEKELMRFLEVLLSFATGLTLSDRAVGVVLDISHKTASRWMTAARFARDNQQHPGLSLYHHMALEVTNKINYLNQRNADSGIFADIVSLPRGRRLQALRTTLANRRV